MQPLAQSPLNRKSHGIHHTKTCPLAEHVWRYQRPSRCNQHVEFSTFRGSANLLRPHLPRACGYNMQLLLDKRGRMLFGSSTTSASTIQTSRSNLRRRSGLAMGARRRSARSPLRDSAFFVVRRKLVSLLDELASKLLQQQPGNLGRQHLTPLLTLSFRFSSPFSQ